MIPSTLVTNHSMVGGSSTVYVKILTYEPVRLKCSSRAATLNPTMDLKAVPDPTRVRGLPMLAQQPQPTPSSSMTCKEVPATRSISSLTLINVSFLQKKFLLYFLVTNRFMSSSQPLDNLKTSEKTLINVCHKLPRWLAHALLS